MYSICKGFSKSSALFEDAMKLESAVLLPEHILHSLTKPNIES